MHRRRVAVTGLGILAANGIGVDAFWSSLLECRSGIRRITLFDTTKFPNVIAGEVQDFRFEDFNRGRHAAHRLSRQSQLALAAAQLALEHGGISQDYLQRERPDALVALGVSTSSFDMFEKGKEQLMNRGPHRVNPFMISAGQPYASTSLLAEMLNLPCQCHALSSACTAGLDAIKVASDTIARGEVTFALAGGTDAFVSPLGIAGFLSSGLIPRWDGPPEKASRPFDRDRKGGILSEGAAMVLLEDLDHVVARGGRPLAELVGFGQSVDQVKTEPCSGFSEAMRRAIANACLLPEDIDYVCAHGPSDPVIDRAETLALKEVLGAHAYRVPTSSIKGCTGNPLSAAGPLQVAAAAMAIQTDTVPPTTNYEHSDIDCDLDYVPSAPRRASVGHALIDLHGLGGRNTCAVLRRIA